MRIAFFHNLPSGGAKRSAYELVRLLSINHSIDLFLYDKSAENFLDSRKFVRSTTIIAGGVTQSKGGIWRIISIWKVRLASKRVAEIMNGCNYDVALVMQCKVSNSPFVLRYLKLPSLFLCHEPLAKIMEPHYRKTEVGNFSSVLKQLFLNWTISIDRSNALMATEICTNSMYSVENIYRYYGKYARLNYLGVDKKQFYPKFLDRSSLVLSVGSLNISKGQDFVIESVGTMKVKPKILFIYNVSYGATTFKQELTDRARELGVDVSFSNMVDDNVLVESYNRAIVTVFPSRLEPLGLVPLESMACGTPVVGVAEAGIRETIQDGETGLLTERDPVEFGKAISKLMFDKELWCKLSRNGLNKVSERWTWESAIETLETNLQRTIDSVNDDRSM